MKLPEEAAFSPQGVAGGWDVPLDHWTVKALDKAITGLIEAGNALCFAAEISGGTAGRDEGLVEAIGKWANERDKQKQIRAIVRYEGNDYPIGAGVLALDAASVVALQNDELDNLAREIASTVVRDDPSEPGIVAFARIIALEAARLGLEAGTNMQRERDAVIAEKHPIGGGTLSSWVNTNESPMGATRRHIAFAIRTQL